MSRVVRFSTQHEASELALNSDVTQILTTLERHSVSVRAIRTHEPSLERLFLKLTGASVA
jgi:phosphohistidine phosphatase SixA